MSKKVLGLVLELNPPHTGHLYFINEAKKRVNPDVTIAVVSSSFTMRGESMVMDKFEKANLLKKIGIDIVMELPFLSCLNSSDIFCYNAINILSKMNITDLCFGVELDDLDKLKEIGLITTSQKFNSDIKKYLDLGFSYPTASFKALKDITDDEVIINNYTLPNNTLALGYLKSLEELKNDKVKITTIKRIDNNYYDDVLYDNKYSSATAIRKAIDENSDVSKFTFYNYDFYKPSLMEEKLFFLLRHFLNMNNNLNAISQVNEGIENRLINVLKTSSTYEEFINNAATKRYPKNRIKRLILHILLSTPKELENKRISYLRVMTFNDVGKKHINTLDKEIKQNIITTFKNNEDNIVISYELKATKLWGEITNNNDIYLKEYNIPLRKEENGK